MRLFKNQPTNETIITVCIRPSTSIHRDITSSSAEGWNSGFELCTEQLSLGKQLNVTLVQSYTQPFMSKANLRRHIHCLTKRYFSRYQEIKNPSSSFAKSVRTNKCDHLWNTKANETLWKKSNTHYWPWLLYNIVLVAAWSKIKTSRFWKQVLMRKIVWIHSQNIQHFPWQ